MPKGNPQAYLSRKKKARKAVKPDLVAERAKGLMAAFAARRKK